MSKVKKTEPLTGKELLKKLKEIPHLSRTEKARECGYEVTKNKQTRVNLSQFMNAILDAKGVSLEPEKGQKGRGKEATYRVTVHKNGQIVLGAAYTKEMKLNPGDELELKLGYKHIHLHPVKSSTEE